MITFGGFGGSWAGLLILLEESHLNADVCCRGSTLTRRWCAYHPLGWISNIFDNTKEIFARCSKSPSPACIAMGMKWTGAACTTWWAAMPNSRYEQAVRMTHVKFRSCWFSSVAFEPRCNLHLHSSWLRWNGANVLKVMVLQFTTQWPSSCFKRRPTLFQSHPSTPNKMTRGGGLKGSVPSKWQRELEAKAYAQSISTRWKTQHTTRICEAHVTLSDNGRARQVLTVVLVQVPVRRVPGVSRRSSRIESKMRVARPIWSKIKTK